MEVTFIQTSDAKKYIHLFEFTSKTVLRYCSEKNYVFETFIGIKRGKQPWHATFNRIFMLRDMVQRGYRGWVCYMDADSFVCDLSFDLEYYLKDKSNFAVIAARSGVTPPAYWQVNIGVILINLQHFVARQIIEDWYLMFDRLAGREFDEASWDDVLNDQDMFQLILKNNSELEKYVFIDEGSDGTINSSSAKFIKQILRVRGSMEERLEQAKRATAYVLRSVETEDAVSEQKNNALEVCGRDIMVALYRTLLLREADPGGLESSLNMYLGNGCSVENAIAIMLASDEFSSNIEAFTRKYILAEP